MLIKFIAAVVITEALTELIIEAEITEPVKLRIISLGRFFEKLFTCSYCMSVWVGIFISYLFRLSVGLHYLGWIEPLILGLVVHRLSNVCHDLISIMVKAKMPDIPRE